MWNPENSLASRLQGFMLGQFDFACSNFLHITADRNHYDSQQVSFSLTVMRPTMYFFALYIHLYFSKRQKVAKKLVEFNTKLYLDCNTIFHGWPHFCFVCYQHSLCLWQGSRNCWLDKTAGLEITVTISCLVSKKQISLRFSCILS